MPLNSIPPMPPDGTHFTLSYVRLPASDQSFVVHVGGTPFTCEISTLQLIHYSKLLHTDAKNLVEKIESGQIGSNKASWIIALFDIQEGLGTHGNRAFQYLLPGRIGTRLRTQLANSTYRFPVLEIFGPEVITFPWEWLYNEEYVNVNPQDDPMRIMADFWALSWVISRRKDAETSKLGTTIPADERLNSPPHVGLLLQSDLKTRQDVLNVFKILEGEGRIKLTVFPDTVENDPQELLTVPHPIMLSKFYKFISTPFDILHLHCHAEIDEDNPLASSLKVTPNHKIQIAHFDTSLLEVNSPVIFLNTCSNIMYHPLWSTDFVAAFQRRSKRDANLIAVESLLESTIAREFAEAFYDRFLHKDITKRESLGFALCSARYSILENHVSPAALVAMFYSIHARPYFSSVA